MALEQISRRIPRGNPYFWTTWVTKYLVGESSCEWAAWLKGNYKNYEKAPSDFDFTSWQMNHTALLNQVKEQLESDGRTVFTENQNSFNLRGATAALGGKPDLIALSESGGTIYDVKTGKPNPSHSAQVMIYMYGVPRALPQYNGITFDGKVVYQDHTVDIPGGAVDGAFIHQLAQLLKRLSSSKPSSKVPSQAECRFCDISEVECPEKILQNQRQEGMTDDF